MTDPAPTAPTATTGTTGTTDTTGAGTTGAGTTGAGTTGAGTTGADGASGEAQPFRLLPQLDDLNRPFWTGGEHGELRFWRCRACGHRIHPPSVRCPRCLSKDLAVEAVSGRAVVHTFTVNHQPWFPGLEPPYVVAIVELPEQPGLRVTTSLVDVPIDGVRIGLEVEVLFERYDDVWLPFFRPVRPGAGDAGDAGGSGGAG